MFQYYAYVNNGLVENVIVCNSDEDFRSLTESFPMGMYVGEWIKVTEETRRPNSGWTYSKEHGKFIPEQPYPSWILGEDLYWQSPIAKPDNEKSVWDEENQTWITFTNAPCTTCS